MKTTLPQIRTLAALAAGLLSIHLASAQNIWNATNGVSADTNWSTAANWSLAAIPGAGDSVQFLDNGTTAGAQGTINNVVDYSTNIGNLWYGNTNGFHTTFIADGQTLTINGTGIPGIANTTLLGVGRDDYTVPNQTIYGTITGLNGTLLITNTGGSIQVRMGTRTNPAATKATLDMSGLGTLMADLVRLSAGVESGDPRGCAGFIYLARTNLLRLRGTGQDANFSSGNPAFYIGHNTLAGGANTNGSAIYLGITNAIAADYVVIGRGNQSNVFCGFNPAFIASSPYAWIRGLNATNAPFTNRVGAYKVGDNSAGSGSSPSWATNDFTGGTVDALIDNLLIGFSRSSGANSNQGVGTLTFNVGTIDANRVTLGYNTNELCTAIGTLNVNGGTLIANTMLQLAQVNPIATGPVAALTTGTLNIRGGAQVFANTITNSGGIGRIAITNGNLLVTNFIGITGFPVNFLALSNATLTLPSYPSPTPAALVTNLAVGGTTNKINVSSIGAILSYPAQLVMIKYSGALSGTFNIGLGTLPTTVGTPFAGFISNNTANSSVDLVLTAGPISRTLTWKGLNGVTLDSDWDVATTPTWQTNSVATTFNQLDFVRFDDTGSTNVVNLTTALFPGGVTVSNNSVNYTLTDFGSGLGKLSGSGNFIKQGSGTLVIDNTGVNNSIGSMSISNGSTVRVGNNDTAGNLPGSGAVINNGSLIFYRTDSSSVGNVISGSGSISNAAGTLTLSGANTFTGAVTVASGSTLVAGNSSALGNPTNAGTTIYNGATLDVGPPGFGANALNLGQETVTVSGAGVDTVSGAILNSSSTSQQNALQRVTLAGNTTFGGNARWDIRATGGSTGDPAGASLSTGGNAYNLAKVGGNFVGLVSVTVDPALGDIDIQAGQLDIEGNTTGLGNTTKTLTVESGATLFLQNATNRLNKQFVINGDGLNTSVSNNAGANTIVGPMTLNGDCFFTVGGTSLTLNNTISGSGRLFKTGYATSPLVLSGAANQTGGTYLSGPASGNSILAVNGTTSAGVTNEANTTITGTGTIGGTVQVSGTLNPGTIGGAGTLASGTLEMGGGGLTFDLSSVNTIGGGVNDLLTVTGDVDGGGTTITINPILSTLSGPYRLINYSGTLLTGFGSVSLVAPTRYTLGLDTSTAGQVNLTVAGSPANVKWNSTSDTTWDTGSTPNWLNLGTASADSFFAADNVLLDDTAGVTNFLNIATNTSVLPGSITNNSSANNFTIGGGGRISGGSPIVKLGSSILTLATSNDFLGSVTVQSGTLRVASGTALGATNGSTTIASGATIDLGGTNMAANVLNLGFEPLFVSGSGVGGLGAVVNTGSNNQQNAIQVMTLTGDTVWGGAPNGGTANGRWDIRGTLGGLASNGGTNAILSTGGNPYNITKISLNQIQLAGPRVDPALANINVLAGTLGIQGSMTSLGNPAATILVSNATFHFFQVSNTLSKVCVLRDGAVLNNNNGSNTFGGPITLIGSNRFDIGGVWMILTNTIGGTGTLAKVGGTAPLFLMVSNTFSGRTLVSNGTLYLTNNGSIQVCSNITVTASIDVLGRPDKTLTLTSGQTLNGTGTLFGNLVASSGATVAPGLSIGTLTATNGTVTFQAGSTAQMELNRTNSTTSDLLRGTTNITYAGTLSLVNIGPPLQAGDSFKLFSATNYLASFSSLTPTQPGLGLKWDTSQMNASGTNGGTLKVAVLPKPGISNTVLSGSSIVMGGTNGTAGYSYRVLSSTNVTLPVSSWINLGTNFFDSSGNFQFSSGITNAQQFFIVQAL